MFDFCLNETWQGEGKGTGRTRSPIGEESFRAAHGRDGGFEEQGEVITSFSEGRRSWTVLKFVLNGVREERLTQTTTGMETQRAIPIEKAKEFFAITQLKFVVHVCEYYVNFRHYVEPETISS